MIQTKWKKRYSKNKRVGDYRELAAACGITPLAAKILVNRGHQTTEAVKKFLNPQVTDLTDPFLLPDMELAVERLLKARAAGEKVCIFGDYDADGTTAVAILTDYFEKLGINVCHRIPNRLLEGYGMSLAALAELAEDGVELVLTVDTGISSHQESLYLKEQGIDLIVTDHHECHGEMPEAVAIVDPKRPDSELDFKELCGAGIAFKLIQALDERLGLGTDLREYIECAGVATIADIVPLEDENRTIAGLALTYLNAGAVNKGLAALIEVSDLQGRKLTAGNVGFVLAPKINAAGRLGDAEQVIALYLAKTPEAATAVASHLAGENTKRQSIEKEILDAAQAEVIAKEYGVDNTIVVAGEGWHSGVIGIVASRLQEEYYRPAIVIGIEDGVGKGSCRSVPGYNIFEALCDSDELFLNFGGHEQAAGFSIAAENIDELRRRLNDYGAAHAIEKHLVRTVYYDEEMEPAEVDEALVSQVEAFEPCGVGNPKPCFMVRDAVATDLRTMGKTQDHLSFMAGGVRCIGFGYGSQLGALQGEPLAFLGRPEFNEFRGRRSVQLLLKDLKTNLSYEIDEALSLVAGIEEGMPLLPEALEKIALPERDDLLSVYSLAKNLDGQEKKLAYVLSKVRSNSVFQFFAALVSLRELEVIDYTINAETISVKGLPTTEKKDVKTAPFMLKLNQILSER